MVAKYDLFALEVLKAWIDPVRENPRTIHHQGRGVFMVAGEAIRLPVLYFDPLRFTHPMRNT
jgi:hypothetical protein